MTVKQMLKNNPVFQDAVVLAGEAGLCSEVSSVMVLEAPDIENWGREGQLLLTSFFALQSLDVERSRDFLQKCRSLGISGLVVKMGRLISDIPGFFADYCNCYGIPLITLPQDVAYERVIISILEPIITQMARSQSQSQKYNDLLNDLLNGRLPDHDAADQALQYLHLDSGMFYQTVLIQFPFLSDAAPEEPSLISRIDKYLQREFHNAGLRSISLQGHDRLTLLFNFSSGTEPALTAARMQEFQTTLQNHFHFPEPDIQVALSDIGGRGRIAALNRQVLGVRRIMNLLGERSYVRDFKSLGIYRLFLDQNNLPLLDSLITPEHRKMWEEEPEFWKTLVTFVSCGQNYSDTAAKLFLHPKTIKYRMGKIRPLLPLELSDPEEVFAILLDARLFLLKEHIQDQASPAEDGLSTG